MIDEGRFDRERSLRQELWDKTVAALAEIRPPIDESIREMITALNVCGIKTSASCGGHAESDRQEGNTPFPWILFSCEGQKDAWSALELLLAKFHEGRNAESDTKLRVTLPTHNEFLLTGVADDLRERFAAGTLADAELHDLAEKLPQRQEAMAVFGRFLKGRFFEDSRAEI